MVVGSTSPCLFMRKASYFLRGAFAGASVGTPWTRASKVRLKNTFSIRHRHCLGSLAAIVDQNASTSAQFFAINLHETVAVVAITRWPNNAELCCLACWVLRSILPATVSTGLPEVSDGDDLGSHHDDENTCPGYRDGGSGARTDRTQEDNCDGGDAEEGFLERLLRLAQETRVRSKGGDTHGASSV